ncbi:hypothetical protein BGZ76_009108 [Entomortierella beljakovae]|nr:hypothetical protein BGZ76_009108 [Entomortierella beljakovae]
MPESTALRDNSAYENSPTQRRRERRAKLREFLNTTQRINIPKVPDFSLMAKSSSEDYSPTLTTSRLVIRRTSDIDRPSLDRILMEQKPRGGIGQDRTWQCLIDISAGLEAIHNTNIVHLDLKPENIFVGSSGDLKIGDFGHSVMLPIHETDGIEGDRRYVAPELLNNQCGKFSDIFSLGVTVYEMLSNQCGKIPGKGPEWQSLRDGQFSFLPKMDEDWTDICGESTDVVLVESKPVRHVKFCQSQRKILDIIKEMMDADYQNRPLVRTIHMVASKQYATKTLNKLEALYTID